MQTKQAVDAATWVPLIDKLNERSEPVITTAKARELETLLRTSHKQFLTDFIEAGGVKSLLNLSMYFAKKCPKTADERSLLFLVMKSFESLMNNHVGMQGMLENEGCITNLALSMDFTDLNDLSVAKEALLLLGATCFFSAKGRTLVINAMEECRRKWRETNRFETLVDAFRQCKDNEFRAAAAAFITTIVNSAASVDSRIKLRNDFIALNILDVFHEVCNKANDESVASVTINTQAQVFEDLMLSDQAEAIHNMLDGRDGVGDDEGVLDLSDQTACVKYLRDSAQASGCSEYLLEVTQLLLLIPSERSYGLPMWKGIAQFIREATDYVAQGSSTAADRKEKAPKLNYQILHGLLDERRKIEKQLVKLGDSDDIIKKQRKQIEDMIRDMSDPKKAGQGGKLQEENDLMRAKIKDLLAEIAALKKASFVLQGELRQAQAALAAAKENGGAGNTASPAAASPTSASATPSTAGAATPTPAAGGGSAPAPALAAKGGALAAMLAARAGGAPPAATASASAAPESAPTPVAKPPPGEIDPKFLKYYRMKKSGLPEGAILNAMLRDGVMCPPDFFDDEQIAAQASSAASTTSKPKTPAGGIPGKGPNGANGNAADDANSKMPQKKQRQPNLPMRGIFWTKLPPSELEGTIWPELNDEVVKLDIPDLEAKFSKPPEKSKAVAAPKADTGAAAKVEKIHIVDGKRQQNVGITISRFHSTPQEVKKSIMRVDDTILSLERSKALLAIAPTADELTMLRAYTGDVKLLTDEDQFLMEMATIPRLDQRLKAITLRHTFEKETTDIKNKLTTVRAACNEIDKSIEIKKLFEIILAVGNYINGGTPRGGAWGFKLDVLAKLDTIHENESRQSLVHYIVRLAIKSYPELLGLSLSKASAASTLSMTEINKDLNALSQGMRLLKKELDAEHADKEDRFAKVFGTFELKGTKQLSEIEADYHDVLDVFTKLVEKFGEKGKMEPDAFFTMFVNFEYQFKEAIKYIDAEKEKQIKAKKLEEQKEHLAKLKSARLGTQVASTPTNGSSSGGGGAIDEFQKINQGGDANQIKESLRARYKNQGTQAGEEAMSGADELKKAMAKRKAAKQ